MHFSELSIFFLDALHTIPMYWCFNSALKHSKWRNNLRTVLSFSSFPMKSGSCCLELRRLKKFYSRKRPEFLWLIRYQRWNLGCCCFFIQNQKWITRCLKSSRDIRLHALNLQAIVKQYIKVDECLSECDRPIESYRSISPARSQSWQVLFFSSIREVRWCLAINNGSSFSFFMAFDEWPFLPRVFVWWIGPSTYDLIKIHRLFFFTHFISVRSVWHMYSLEFCDFNQNSLNFEILLSL